MTQPLKLLVVLEALNFVERVLWQFSANLEEKLEVVIFLLTEMEPNGADANFSLLLDGISECRAL